MTVDDLLRQAEGKTFERNLSSPNVALRTLGRHLGASTCDMALRLVESCNGSARCDYVIDYINESAGRR